MSTPKPLPLFISAEAAVKSDRADYVSIFDVSTPITANNLKLFYSKGEIISEAVKKLTNEGVKVSHIGKYSIHIVAPLAIFERVFKVKIIQIEHPDLKIPFLSVEGASKAGFIETDSGNFKDLLAGIVLSQETRLDQLDIPPESHDEAKRKKHLYLEDIPQLLGKLPTDVNHGKGIKIAVLDSGVHKNHPYFQKNFKEAIESRVSLYRSPYFTSTLGELSKLDKVPNLLSRALSLSNDFNVKKRSQELITQEEVQEIERILYDFYELIFSKVGLIQEVIEARLAKKYPDEIKSITNLLEKLNTSKDKELTKLTPLPEIKNFFINLFLLRQVIIKFLNEKNDIKENLSKEDGDGHGTGMVSVVLSVAPEADIEVSKTISDSQTLKSKAVTIHSDFKAVFEDALKRSPDILSCSWGVSLTSDDKSKRSWDALLLEAEKENAFAVFSVGNKGINGNNANVSGLSEIAFSEGDEKNSFIMVGGAYKDGDKIFASSLTLAKEKSSTKRIPEICALCGKNDDTTLSEGYIWLPLAVDSGNVNKIWELSTGGSSAATAQISAACSLIKKVFKDSSQTLSNKSLKRILKLTADTLTNGSFQSSGKDEPFPEFDFTGIVNIHNALQLAQFCTTVVSIRTATVGEVLDKLIEKLAEIGPPVGSAPQRNLTIFLNGRKNELDYIEASKTVRNSFVLKSKSTV